MKKTLILFLLIIIANSIYSQDLIVTNDGDSINCKITKIRANNVYFTFKHKNEIRNTMLHLSNIEDFRYHYYYISDFYEDDIIGYDNFQRLKFAINGGYSYRIGRLHEDIPSDLKNYFKELKSGYHFGGDITYYFTEFIGVGGKCSIFKSSNSIDGEIVMTVAGITRNGKMSDNETITFIGPLFSNRFLNRNKSNALFTNVSLGYLGYLDNMVLIDKYQIKGNTVGFAFDIGYDIGLSKNFSVGFQFSLLLGSLSKYSLNDGMRIETVELEKDNYENLSRIDFSIGLRFHR